LQLVCIATGGTFTLTFKGETTRKIPYDASSARLKAYLQELTTISSQYYDALKVDYVGVNTKVRPSLRHAQRGGDG
jgi:hypothetical protein